MVPPFASVHNLLCFASQDGTRSSDFLTMVPTCVKDGAYYCYCAYVLRITRYSGFLWMVPTNTGIFLRGLKLYGESRTYQMLLVTQKKIGGNHAFFRDN